ncbi:unnamed protein product [Pleuronectes platessa]|uniref:Uncharacterized protein n=1 Tax=Pleuronectes platessa TaxID=8262 RepID=A0A9N7VFH7_PLEPL|nr:unnamed protein product [Pleuronectes platessa]
MSSPAESDMRLYVNIVFFCLAINVQDDGARSVWVELGKRSPGRQPRMAPGQHAKSSLEGLTRLKAASAFDEVGEAVPGQDWVRDEGVGPESPLSGQSSEGNNTSLADDIENIPLSEKISEDVTTLLSRELDLSVLEKNHSHDILTVLDCFTILLLFMAIDSY